MDSTPPQPPPCLPTTRPLAVNSASSWRELLCRVPADPLGVNHHCAEDKKNDEFADMPPLESIPRATRRSSRSRAKRPSLETEPCSPHKRRKTGECKPPPNAKLDDVPESNETVVSCCICMGQPESNDLSSVNGCDHQFCFHCIATWSDRENTCPLCKARFTKIDRINPQKKRSRSKTSTPNSKRVKNRDQRSEIISTAALEGLLASLGSTGDAFQGGSRLGRFIFAHMQPEGMPRSSATGGLSTRITFSLQESLARDEEEEAFPSFMRISMMRSTFWTQPRSHATNDTDESAGRAPENPLTIDDSDDDDIEFVGVTRSV